MRPSGFLSALLPLALSMAATVQAQNLSAIVMPPPEAPALTQAAQSALDAVNARVPQLDTAGLLAQLKAQPETVVIDVRTPAELNLLGGYIDAPRFANVTRGWLEFQIETVVPDKNTPIVVYCGVSQRSPLAADTLGKLGYTAVKNYADGYLAWQKAKGFPFGWEIMVWNDGNMYQLTTNFFYDMSPQVQGTQVAWYGWDGNDYEIYLHDFAAGLSLLSIVCTAAYFRAPSSLRPSKGIPRVLTGL